MVLLSQVEDTFQIAGRGCVVVPAIPRSELNFSLRAEDPIQLRIADGRIINTHIVSIELACGPQVKDRMAFLLPGTIKAEEVPKGNRDLDCAKINSAAHPNISSAPRGLPLYNKE
jgi:hypothetical protein